MAGLPVADLDSGTHSCANALFLRHHIALTTSHLKRPPKAQCGGFTQETTGLQNLQKELGDSPWDIDRSISLKSSG